MCVFVCSWIGMIWQVGQMMRFAAKITIWLLHEMCVIRPLDQRLASLRTWTDHLVQLSELPLAWGWRLETGIFLCLLSCCTKMLLCWPVRPFIAYGMAFKPQCEQSRRRGLLDCSKHSLRQMEGNEDTYTSIELSHESRHGINKGWSQSLSFKILLFLGRLGGLGVKVATICCNCRGNYIPILPTENANICVEPLC